MGRKSMSRKSKCNRKIKSMRRVQYGGNMSRVGSRAQVMHGTAKMTSGGLTKKNLKYNKRGKIVSKKASTRAKKSKTLIKAGYKTAKGRFGFVKTK